MKKIFLSVLLITLACGALLEEKAPKPNIIFVMIDDLGHYNVNLTGTRNPEIHSPNFDEFVSTGIYLDQAYTYKYCSPTRCSFLTGRLPVHMKQDNGEYLGIPENITIIPKKLKEAGYNTHQVGKWHAGFASHKMVPAGRGFDTSFGYLHAMEDHYSQTTRGYVDLWVAESPEKQYPGLEYNGTKYNTYMYNDRVMEILDKQTENEPFFLYWAEQNNHSPLQVPDKYTELYPEEDMPSYRQDRQSYQGMVSCWDEMLGNVTKKLKEKGLWENTLIVMSSDNGGPEYSGGAGNNWPLKGSKMSPWQGGIRVVSAINGGFLPNHLRGSTVDQYVHIADWYSTFCGLAGVDPIDDHEGLPSIDSLNVWDLVTGQNKTSPRTVIHNEGTKGSDDGSIIVGDYKLIRAKVVEYAAHTSKHFPNKTTDEIATHLQLCGNGCLYNIREDPSEYNDLAKSKPVILKLMQEALTKANTEVFDEATAFPDGYNDGQIMKQQAEDYGGVWGPHF